MRELFLLLLAVNLGYWAWSEWIAPEAVPPAPRPAPAVASLQLVSELDTPLPGARPGQFAEQTEPTVPQVSAPAEAGTDEAVVDAPAEATALPASGTEGAQPGDSQPGQAEVPLDLAEPGLASADEPAGSDAQVEGPLPPRPPPQAVALAQPRCASIGPYLDLTEAADAAASLRERGFESTQRLTESNVWVGHWVYLPPYTTRAEAIAAVENLRDAGLSDLYIEPGGDMQNAVSLGLFSDRERAETRAGEIRRQGLSPRIRDRFRTASVYWVDFEIAAGQEIDRAELQTRPNRIIRLELRDCDDALAQAPAG